jgi:hypothetical protein
MRCPTSENCHLHPLLSRCLVGGNACSVKVTGRSVCRIVAECLDADGLEPWYCTGHPRGGAGGAGGAGGGLVRPSPGVLVGWVNGVSGILI